LLFDDLWIVVTEALEDRGQLPAFDDRPNQFLHAALCCYGIIQDDESLGALLALCLFEFAHDGDCTE
jgi:hypothetical protein